MKVFYKIFGEAYWHNITKYNEQLPEWETNINTELLEFELSLITPFDESDNVIIVKTGDDIVLTNDDITDVIGGVLAGVIISVNTTILGRSNNDYWEVKYDIRVRNRDFSSKYVYFDEKVPISLEDLLDKIFYDFTDYEGNTYMPSVSNNESGILNGYTGGTINGNIVPKHINLSDNIEVQSFESKGSPLTCLVDLLESIGYYFSIQYFVEKHSVNQLNLVQQYVIFSTQGIVPTNEWGLGIDNTIFKKGLVTNLNYVENNTNSSKEYPAERDLNYSEDISDLVNMYVLDLLIQNGFELTKETKFIQESNLTEIETEETARDIIYCCRVVSSNITEVISSTQFKVPQSDSEKLLYDQSNLAKDTMVCKITKNDLSEEYYRIFTISGTIITLNNAISGLDTTYKFELVNGLDIYDKDFPNLNNIEYGVSKDINNRSKASVKFLPMSKPNVGDTFAIYYYKLKNELRKEIFDSNIIQYGMFYREENIDVAITEEQYIYLKNEILKYTVPKKSITFTSYRPVECKIGYLIPINITNEDGTKIIYNDNMIVTSIKNKFISNYGIDNTYLVEQNITISDYRLKLQDVIKRLKKSAKKVQSNSQGIVTNNIYPLIEFI